VLNEIHDKSLGTVISELKLELAEFIQTRYLMLSSELKTKLSQLKMSAPIMAVALALCAAGFLVLSAALVAVIAIAFGGGIGAWAMSAGIVGAAYLILGGLAGVLAWRQISTFDLTPTRTINVLKQDQVWLQNEARSQL
jgi:fatty acid desaturase